MKTEKELLTIVKKVQNLTKSNVILTGSFALKLYGLLNDFTPHDIDLIVSPYLTDKDKETFKLLSDVCPSSCPVRDIYSAKVKYQFHIDKVNIDVFTQTIDNYFVYDDVKVNSPINVLKAKARFNRRKDWQGVYKVIEAVMNPFKTNYYEKRKRPYRRFFRITC